MESTTYTYPIVIRERHLDTFGHVNNAAYLEILEEARWEIITGRGFGLHEVQASRLGPVILDIHIRFLKELKLRDGIVVKTKLESYEGKVGVLKQWMEGAHSLVYCEADLKIGLFDLERRKLVAPSPEWLAALGAK